VDTSGDAPRDAGDTAAGGGQLRSIAIIVVFYIAVPLAVYFALRSAGGSTLSVPWFSPGSL
jgi:hypothetical protein